MTTERYDTTRTAWEDIWQGASVQAELDIVQAERSWQTIQAYVPYLPKDEWVLEAGSGLSAVVLTLRQRGYRVIGLDYAINALQKSRGYAPDLPLTAGDVHQLPLEDESVGAYLSFGVLEHFEHGMQPALHEANRVLKQNGVIVLTIPYPNVVYRLVQLKRHLLNETTLTDEDFYESTYTRAALVSNLHQAGFRVLLAQPTSHAFTLWGLGGPFQGTGYYETSRLADRAGAALAEVLPWAFNFSTLIVARKR